MLQVGLMAGSYTASNDFALLGKSGYEAGGILGMAIGATLCAVVTGGILWRRTR